MPSQATRPPLVGMPAVWLRDNCPCPLCRDPVSGQRLLHITDIPPDIAVAEVVSSGGTVSVLFHPDGHRAVFDRDWLARHAGPARGGPPDPRTEDARRLWSAAELGGEPPRGSWPRYLAHQPAHPPAHGQPVPRPGADRATAALPAQRGRRWRLRVRGRVPRRRRAPGAGPGRVRHPHRHPGHLRIPRRRHGAVRHPAADQPGRPWADPGDPVGAARPDRVRPPGTPAPAGLHADLDGVGSAVAVAERAATGIIRRKDQI
jgi:hypothetical protein